MVNDTALGRIDVDTHIAKGLINIQYMQIWSCLWEKNNKSWYCLGSAYTITLF